VSLISGKDWARLFASLPVGTAFVLGSCWLIVSFLAALAFSIRVHSE
jgi:hypothetical protein